jgi:flavodoxin
MKKFNKILIIYDSRPETQNTKRIARVMAKVLKADITSLDEVLKYEIQKYDLVGFGSGIFFYKFSKTLRQYIDKLMPYEQKCFVFYTSGMKECIKASVQLVNLLESKKRKNIGI